MKRFVKVLISVCFLFIFFSHIFSNGIAFSDAHIWSIENYKIIPELKGQTFQIKNVDISRKEFLKMIRNPLSFSLLSNAGPIAGLVNNQKELVIFSLTEFEDESEFQEVSRFNLENMLGDNIKMRYVFSDVENRLEDRIIIADYDNDTLIIMEYDGSEIEIKNALKFNNKHFLDNFKVICGYTENNAMRMIFSKDDIVYVVENNTMKLLKAKQFKGWKTLYGYRRKAKSQSTVDSVYLYQINGRIFRKYDFIRDKTIYELNLNSTPIKGEVVNVEVKVDYIFILTEFNNKSILYKCNEESFGWFSYTDVFEDYTKFGKIEDVCYFSTEKKYMGLELFQKNAQPPIKFIDIISHVWKEIQSEGEQIDENDKTTKDRVITKVITDIAKWNHPTKAVFKKYGYNVTKIEFTHNNTYPIFYVNGDVDYVFSNEPFLEELAKNNGYWDFTIKIGIQSLEVTCNKKQKKIENKMIIIEP
jgi:hypothetical protein